VRAVHQPLNRHIQALKKRDADISVYIATEQRNGAIQETEDQNLAAFFFEAALKLPTIPGREKPSKRSHILSNRQIYSDLVVVYHLFTLSAVVCIASLAS